jgi:hypothetical protein
VRIADTDEEAWQIEEEIREAKDFSVICAPIASDRPYICLLAASGR